jgi:aminomethyltransferase
LITIIYINRDLKNDFMAKKTPLYDEHAKLGARIIDFNGWLMPVYYSNVIEEHNTVRRDAGMFDTCHMGEFFIEGKDAFSLVQMLITNDLGRLSDGKAFYTQMCYENGGIVDDLFVYRFNQNKYMLVVNAGNVEKDFSWIIGKKGVFDARAINKTKEMAKIDVQGPNALCILLELTDYDLRDLKRFSFIEGNIKNVPAILSRTGYTGEDGFELYFDSGSAALVWSILLKAGVKPIGLGARDTLRIEAGYSLYGHELNEIVNPFEADTSFVVKLDKGEFIGREALLKQKEGLKKRVVTFEMVDKGVARHGYGVFKEGRKIGFVTSGTYSPTFGKPLGMAMVESCEAKADNNIEIEIRGKMHRAKVAQKPFYKFGGKL